MFVALTRSDLFHVLTCPSHCASQHVSVFPSLTFLLYFDSPPSPQTAISSLCVPLTIFVSVNRRISGLCVLQDVSCLLVFVRSVFSLLPFSASQKLCSKLSSFCANDDIHHKLIGTSLLSSSAISDIGNSDNSHPRPCMPFLCLTV
jgi:hypothetical protein